MKKRIFAAIIALIMAVSSFAPLCANAVTYPYVDENGIYYFKSMNNVVEFETDFDTMVDYFLIHLKARDTKIGFYFATPAQSYTYSTNSQFTDAFNALLNDTLNAVFTKNTDDPNNADGGDYLFRSIKNFSVGSGSYTSAGVVPSGANEAYYPFYVELNNIQYFSTAAQEQEIQAVCQSFSNLYFESDAAPYEKVKTIYDFVVRNCCYDDDVYDGVYSASSERYNIAHSAYGALIGKTLITGESFDMTSKKTISGQNVISQANQGMAVCEGYSKLFYYLCVKNGIPCKIVDGDYIAEAETESDPHEWNYVWLDDGGGDGYKWFEVDPTFGAQTSYKEVDINNYDYFLRGRSNERFGKVKHQQPYEYKRYDYKDGASPTYNLYDFNEQSSAQDYIASFEDYRFGMSKLTTAEALENGYVVRRLTMYEGEDEYRAALFYSHNNDEHIISINEDGEIEVSEYRAFVYNGKSDAIYEVFVPYLIDEVEFTYDKLTGISEVGNYSITIYGANGTSEIIPFRISKMDLDISNASHYESIEIQDTASYTGNVITPRALIVDGYKNVLVENIDYVIRTYSDANHKNRTEIRDIGQYYIDIDYNIGNNYSGHYYLIFTVDKINIAQINIDDVEFGYLPQYFREKENIFTPADYYMAGAENMRIGDFTLKIGEDVAVSSQGTIEWGESGTITLSGIENSSIVKGDSVKNLTYNVSKQFDISALNGSAACTSAYTYTGEEILPTELDHINERIVQGVDYEIVDYSNNINAGNATIKISGINGCTGEPELYFRINPASITNCQLETKVVSGEVLCTLTFNGTKLAQGKDYTYTITEIDPSTGKTKSGYYFIVLQGINNFNGKINIPVKGTLTKPTSSGNYITLSKSTYTYSGSANKPKVTVYNKNKKAINPYYYTVSYSSNTNPGTAKVSVKFRNGYSGTVTKTFTINPKGTTISSVTAASKAFTVKWKKYATQTTGYEIWIATNSGFTKGKKSYFVTSNSTTSKKITKLSGKKKYYVKIRTYKTVSGKKYYSSWSATKSVTTKK